MEVRDLGEYDLVYEIYTKRSQPQYLHIDVPLTLWQKLDRKFAIKHSTDTTKFMCANEKEIEHLTDLGITLGDVSHDWFKVNLKEEF